MTSVDSGVDTGNDSNDSSITQHDGTCANQSTMTSSTIVTASSNQIEEQSNKQDNFRIAFSPAWPINFNPISSLCPVLENYQCTENNLRSAGSNHSTGPLVSRSSNIMSYQAKMKTLHGLRKSSWTDDFVKEKMRLAAATNNTMLMARLLNKGVSPNNHDVQGRTPLHLAACRGYTDMVRLLLERGADPNRRDCIGNTPLHLATVTSKISVVTLLLQAGTNISSSDRRGYNPLQLAQAKLRMLQYCKGEDMLRVKEEMHNVVSMLLAYLEKQKDGWEKVESLSSLYSRLSLSNTSDQVQDDLKDLLANVDSLKIAS